jgi:lipopolysaccharide transport system permease protein
VSATTLSLRRDLLWELIARDIRLRYRGRVLGLLWSQLGPIASVIVFSLVFTRVIPLRIPNYPVFMLVGIEVWQWLQGGLSAGATSVVGNRDLVRQPGFPLGILPTFAVASQLVSFVLALPVILGAIGITTGRIPPTAVWLPVLVGVQFVLTLSAAYLLSALQVFLRDTAEILAIGLRLLFFVTPIIYDEDRLLSSRFDILFDINPMAHLVTAHRDALLFGRTPNLMAIAVVGLGSLAALAVAIRVYTSVQHRFVDEV